MNTLAELTARVDELTRSVGFWNRVGLWVGLILLLASAAALISQWQRINVSANLDAAKAALASAREHGRQLTAEQRTQLVQRLRTATPKCRTTMIAPDNDREAQQFHLTLSFLLEEAGWLGSRLHRPLMDVPLGIRIIQNEGDTPLPCTTQLVQAFVDSLGEPRPEVRIEPPLNPPDPNYPVGTLRIIVGRMP